MVHVYAIASHPLGQAAMQLAQEGPKTKGIRAVIGVLLMFGILCGGVYMLLQSSFGPKLAYLISGTAFWGSWLVLAVLWFTGVPKIPLGFATVPLSTPRWYGPQGAEATWLTLADHPAVARAHPLPESQLIEVTGDLTNQALLAEKAAAETAAGDAVRDDYARELGVARSDIAVPAVIVAQKTEVVRRGGAIEWARVTFGPAKPNASDPEPTKQLIARIKPKAVDLYRDPGSLSRPTYIALGLFTFLFLLHAFGLAWYEARQKRRQAPVGAPERERASV